MAEYEISKLFVGDLVIQEHQQNGGLGVVTRTQPELQVADILDAEHDSAQIRLAIPGTVSKPVEVIGHISVEDVIDSYSAAAEERGGEVAYIGELLVEAASLGSIDHPTPLRKAA